MDDDVEIRESVAELLRTGDFRARTFDGAMSLLMALDSETPDAFILDDKMPGMGGVELRRRLLGIPHLACLPAILFTASPIANCPAALVLKKPCDVGLMMTVLRAACDDAANRDAASDRS